MHEAMVENNNPWYTLVLDLKTTQEAHHEVLLQLGRQKQLEDQSAPEEIEIASKELKNQKDLYEKSTKKLDLQNRFDQEYEKAKNHWLLEKEKAVLKQENTDLKQKNGELTRLLESCTFVHDLRSEAMDVSA